MAADRPELAFLRVDVSDMKVIRANCRVQFTAQDVAFVAAVLGGQSGQADAVAQLLADPETRDLILDQRLLTWQQGGFSPTFTGAV